MSGWFQGAAAAQKLAEVDRSAQAQVDDIATLKKQLQELLNLGAESRACALASTKVAQLMVEELAAEMKDEPGARRRHSDPRNTEARNATFAAQVKEELSWDTSYKGNFGLGRESKLRNSKKLR